MGYRTDLTDKQWQVIENHLETVNENILFLIVFSIW